MDKKTIKSLIYKAASLLLLSIFLCTSVFIYLQKSFGWFSDNDEVSASGLSVQSGTGANVNIRLARDLDEDGTIEANEYFEEDAYPIFSELIPDNDEPLVVYVVFENKESDPISVSLSMLAPTEEDDIPILHDEHHEITTDPTKAERFHYFGSQIRLNSITVGGTKTTLNKYLLETTALGENTGYQTTYVDQAYDFSTTTDITLISPEAPLTIPAGQTVMVALEFQFVDNQTIQNAYINFGKQININEDTYYTSVCKRTLYCTFEEN